MPTRPTSYSLIKRAACVGLDSDLLLDPPGINCWISLFRYYVVLSTLESLAPKSFFYSFIYLNVVRDDSSIS